MAPSSVDGRSVHQHGRFVDLQCGPWYTGSQRFVEADDHDLVRHSS
jgi:ribosomal protein L31